MAASLFCFFFQKVRFSSLSCPLSSLSLSSFPLSVSLSLSLPARPPFFFKVPETKGYTEQDLPRGRREGGRKLANQTPAPSTESTRSAVSGCLWPLSLLDAFLLLLTKWSCFASSTSSSTAAVTLTPESAGLPILVLLADPTARTLVNRTTSLMSTRPSSQPSAKRTSPGQALCWVPPKSTTAKTASGGGGEERGGFGGADLPWRRPMTSK